VRGALDEAKKYEHMVTQDDKAPKPRPAPATRRIKEPATPKTEEFREADEDPAAANNSGHSALDEPEDTTESQNRSPDKRT